jgi:predicted ATPase
VPAPLTLQKILPAQLPLVGRRREWEYLLQTYQAMKQDSYILGLEGEAGIGKTRLAEEFLMHQQSLGVAILSGRCYEGESGLAYSPLIEALRKVLQTPEGANRLRSTPAHWLSETARLLPEIATNSAGPAIPPALEGSGAQGRFFEGLTQTIITVCGGTPPGICFLDDLQWTDFRRFSKPPMLLLIAWRGEGNDADQRLRRIIAEASRAHKGSLLSLRRLEEVDVAELVSTAFRGEARPPDEWSQRLFQEAEGLPYFVVEFLAAYSTGPVETQTPDWSLPHSVRDLLRSRLASIDEKAGQLLTTAAVIGRSFDFDTLREASGRSEIETVTGLEALIERKLVQERAIGSEKPGMVYDFSHDKLRELVYTDSSLSRRRLLHRRVAEALVSQVRSTRQEAGGLTSQIAHHYRLSGNEPLAADYYKLAGDHARSVFANREALGHYQSALALGYADVPVLHESIGDLQTLLGDYSAALSSYETAAALSLPERLATLEHKIGDIHHRRGEWELAECHYQAAIGVLQLSSEGRSNKRAHWQKMPWNWQTPSRSHLPSLRPITYRASWRGTLEIRWAPYVT